MKNVGKIIVLILIVLYSIGSGIGFNFPREWNFNFQVNLFTIAKTFLTLVLSTAILIYVKRGTKHE